MYDLYQLFDVYVHVPVNSTCEAFGQTYVEALAAGIPGIFTLSGVAREFIKDGENALVVDFNNTGAIYDSLVKLLEDKNKAAQLTQNGKAAVKAFFSLEVYINKLQKFYTTL